MCVLSIPATLNRLWKKSCSLQKHPQAQTIHPKFQLNGQKARPCALETDHMLKRFNCRRQKRRPLSHTQKLNNKAHKKGQRLMHRRFFLRNQTKKQSRNQRQLQNTSQKSLRRNSQHKRSSHKSCTEDQSLHSEATVWFQDVKQWKFRLRSGKFKRKKVSAVNRFELLSRGHEPHKEPLLYTAKKNLSSTRFT